METFLERRLLIVDDEEQTLDACSQILRKEGYIPETANNPLTALEMIKTRFYDLVIADIKLPHMDGIEFLKAIKVIDPDTAVIMITGYATIETAIQSMKIGAYDYITKPFSPDDLRIAISKALEKQSLLNENRELKEKLRNTLGEIEMVGENKEIKQILQLIERIAPTDTTILIQGETGTGKELVARQIHYKSLRSSYPMLSINCAAIPGELLESELFGHEKGAFTGAIRRKKGSFELVNKGTLFLDEISNMSPDLQAKLLRVLEEKEIRPVGSERKLNIDVRIITATNQNLKDMVRKREFREDLYYRLNVIPIYLPPLRNRKEDIPALISHFINKFSKKENKNIRGVTNEALSLLMAYDWPGNIRELENVIERAVILNDKEVIGVECFIYLTRDLQFKDSKDTEKEIEEEIIPQDTDDFPPLEKIEIDYILKVLNATKWNKKKASEILGISTVTLWRKLQGEV